MNSQKNNNALSKSILSIVFSLVIYLLLLASCFITNYLSHLPDIVLFVITNVAFMFAIPGVVMAISAKKNNIEEKKSVIYISALGMLIYTVDIFLYIIVLPLFTSAILFKKPIFATETIQISFTIGFIVAIILLVTYRKAEPKKD